MTDALPRAFRKMHGLGNDFLILDARTRALTLSPARIRALADRHTGVGFDQLLILRPGTGDAVATLDMANADGAPTGACGNVTRCAAWLLMEESGADSVILQSPAGPLRAWRAGPRAVTVDMGPARLTPAEVPVTAADTLNLGLHEGPLHGGCAVGMGNPHVVFFVPDAEAIPLAEQGPRLEHHALFPERTNVEVVSVTAPDRLRLRVWERGTGITRACGTGACAAAVAAVRLGHVSGPVTVDLDGGALHVAWQPDGRVLMTGPVTPVFTGVLDRAWRADP